MKLFELLLSRMDTYHRDTVYRMDEMVKRLPDPRTRDGARFSPRFREGSEQHTPRLAEHELSEVSQPASIRAAPARSRASGQWESGCEPRSVAR